jgi:hypothetical protein
MSGPGLLSQANSNFFIETDGDGIPAHITSVEVAPMSMEAVEMAQGTDSMTLKTLANLKLGDFTITQGLAQCGPQMVWISSIWNKSLMVKNGSVVLADINFKERRRITFGNAQIKEFKGSDFDASSKKAYTITYKFTPETMDYAKTSGAQIKGERGNASAKQFMCNNFRAKVGGLPSDAITKIAGISVTADVTQEYVGVHRLPLLYTAAAKFGDITITNSNRDEIFDAWNKHFKATSDGNHLEKDEFDITVEWLTPDLKSTIGSVTFMGCTMVEMKLGKFEHAKNQMSTFDTKIQYQTFQLMLLDKTY